MQSHLNEELRLVIVQSHQYSLPQRTINVWNNLSADCVQASSVNNIMFKNKIDKYLVKAGFT